MMVITLRTEPRKAAIRCRLPFEGAYYVLPVRPTTWCPACHRSGDEFRIHGENLRRGRDRYTSKAVALCCGTTVGTLEARFDTVFGLEEDERILNGRCRVY